MIRLIYDCIRDPYDIANVLQVVLSLGQCELFFTGNSLRHDHPKVVSRVDSWSSKIRELGYPNFKIHYYPTLESLAKKLNDENIHLIGTSPAAKKSFYELDLKENNFAIVFGTELSGISRNKATLLKEMVKIPMRDDINFMTLSVVTPIIAYEIARQQQLFS